MCRKKHRTFDNELVWFCKLFTVTGIYKSKIIAALEYEFLFIRINTFIHIVSFIQVFVKIREFIGKAYN